MDANLNYVSFKDVSWLQAYGLDENNVLDYFSLSQFYDRSCNNQVIRMQWQFTGGPTAAPTAMEQKLKAMTGLEYALVKAFPPRMFVIHEANRSSPTATTLRASYYIIDGSIYKSPNLQTLLSHRIASAMFHLRSFLTYASDWLEFDPQSSRYLVKNGLKDEMTDDDQEAPVSTLDGVPIDEIDFITHVNQLFMQSQQQ